MPFESREKSERQSVTLSHWWLGPISIRSDTENRISVVTSVRRGDKSEPSYHPDDMIDLRSVDLVTELVEDTEALQLIAQINAGLETIAMKLMELRKNQVFK